MADIIFFIMTAFVFFAIFSFPFWGIAAVIALIKKKTLLGIGFIVLTIITFFFFCLAILFKYRTL
ncbi:MAG: hypothetical protein V1859_09900 [archaeon]